MKNYIVDIKTQELIEVKSLRGTKKLKIGAWLSRGESHDDIYIKKAEWNKLTDDEKDDFASAYVASRIGFNWYESEE